jgi:hypothetical protein
MARNPARRLTIGDAVILIAATALGFASIRWDFALSLGSDRHPYLRLLSHWAHPIQGLLLIEAMGLIVLRLKRPWPSRRRILRELGFAGCLGAWAGLGFSLPSAVYDALSMYDHQTAGRWVWTLARGPAIPAGIVSAWIAIVLARRPHRPRDWIDWLGILVGLGIVVAFLADRAFWIADELFGA